VYPVCDRERLAWRGARSASGSAVARRLLCAAAMRRRLLLGFAALLLTWTAAALTLDRLGHGAPPRGTWDALVVAGCRVRPDGAPSEALRHRTERAVELWRAGRAPLVVFTGGVGANPPSEAEAAAAYARTLGLPAAAERLEDRSTSTEENAAFAAARYPDLRRVLVVTDTYHVVRARRVFARHFAAADATGADAPALYRIPGAFREVVALTLYALSGRL
jgi:uncharacterized SAM-binding protein YcdF (DUF218 family)